MKLLIELFGELEANRVYNDLEFEFPGMHQDWYIRNTINTLKG